MNTHVGPHDGIQMRMQAFHRAKAMEGPWDCTFGRTRNTATTGSLDVDWFRCDYDGPKGP